MRTISQEQNRFEHKYIKKDNGCWEWIGAQGTKGYGNFWYKGKQARAHRISYILYVGPIPKNLQINHRCNNLLCVNPSHLYAGTQSDNMRDMARAGTHPYPSESYGKLEHDDVVQIKRMLRDNIKQWLIAWIFKVSKSSICNINTGRCWFEVKI